MKFKNILVISLITIIITAIIFGSGVFFATKGGFVSGSSSNYDTAIVIEHKWDSTIHIVHEKHTVVEKSYYFKDFDTSIILNKGDCDSVRTYAIKDGNDSIDIVGTVTVHGVLLMRQLSYKWKLPYQTIITNTIFAKQFGPIIGIDLYLTPFNPGIELGYQNKKGFQYKGSYYYDQSIRVGVSKFFDLSRIMSLRKSRKIKPATDE